VGVIIQARLTSKRLPRKILKTIAGKTVLSHVIDRVKKAHLADEIIVASPHKLKLPRDIKSFIGSENDVLERYFLCAQKNKLDVIVRVTADCPLIDPFIIDFAIAYYLAHDHKYVCFAPFDGSDVEVFGRYLLNEAHVDATDPYDREHVTPYMRRVTKLSLDTKDDLKRIREWYGLHK